MLIIGISGKKQSGKDTVANFIKEWYGDKCLHINFADALKNEVCAALKISRAELEQNKKHYRLILQGWGTDYRRQLCGEDYWVKRWAEKCKAEIIAKQPDIVVCSDVRFLNEAQAIRLFGKCSILWRIYRPTDSKDEHQSETELDTYTGHNRVISNEASLEQLKIIVSDALAWTIRDYNKNYATTSNDNK